MQPSDHVQYIYIYTVLLTVLYSGVLKDLSRILHIHVKYMNLKIYIHDLMSRNYLLRHAGRRKKVHGVALASPAWFGVARATTVLVQRVEGGKLECQLFGV